MKLYETIEEMPIYNWFKIVDKSDYSFMLVDPKKDLTQEELADCYTQFEKLYSEFIDEFGLSETFIEVLDLKRIIMLHKIDMAITGNMTKKVHIKIAELDLEKLMKQQNKTETNLTIVIEKHMGFQLDEKKVSVKKFYQYLQDINRSNGRATD